MLPSRLYWTAYLAWQLPGQAAFPFASRERIRRAQSRRVGRMVEHAWRTVPYYQDTMKRLGLTPADFQGPEDLAKLPLLERQDLQRDPEYFVSRARPLGRYFRLLTSGTTGQPRVIFHDPASLYENAAHGERERAVLTPRLGRWAGFREAVIAGSNPTISKVQGFSRRHAFFPPGLRIERRYLFLYDPPEVNARLLHEFRPDLLYSYGSYLEILFPYLVQSGAPFHRPKVIVYTSDGLGDPVRRLIEERFQTPVFGLYGSSEFLKIGFQCDSPLGLHLNTDLYPLRILDAAGRNALPGQTGEVVLSNLVNRATVLLNYRVGDLASFLEQRCPCGRNLPLISFPAGRSDEFIQIPSGATLHPQLFCEILKTEDLWQYQVRQLSPAHIRVSLVPSNRSNRMDLEQRLRQKLAQALPPEVTVELVFGEAPWRTPAGKTAAVLALPR